LPPKLAQFLQRSYGIDAISLLNLGLERLTDEQVVEFARRSQRVVVTLDRDYASIFRRTARPPVSIIYLRVPNNHRRTPALRVILSRFIEHHVDMLEDGPVFVTVTPEAVIAIRGGLDLDTP
jgi:predicted nuclease of predicted toxin-antitoxin system